MDQEVRVPGGTRIGDKIYSMHEYRKYNLLGIPMLCGYKFGFISPDSIWFRWGHHMGSKFFVGVKRVKRYYFLFFFLIFFWRTAGPGWPRWALCPMIRFLLSFSVRRKPECDQRMAQIVNENKKKPVQLAYVVEPGENLKLMCHYW